jgi:transcriptional regulator with XRE-family HTH domain
VSDVFDLETARLKRSAAQKSDIAMQFKEVRISLGLTQLEMAPLLGCNSQDLLSQIERGLIEPSASMYRLLQAYASGYRPADWPKDNPH